MPNTNCVLCSPALHIPVFALHCPAMCLNVHLVLHLVDAGQVSGCQRILCFLIILIYFKKFIYLPIVALAKIPLTLFFLHKISLTNCGVFRDRTPTDNVEFLYIDIKSEWRRNKH